MKEPEKSYVDAAPIVTQHPFQSLKQKEVDDIFLLWGSLIKMSSSAIGG